MMRRFGHFLLALLAECLSWIGFALGFLWGAIVAAYRRGYVRGFESGSEPPVVVLQDEDDL